MLAQLPLERNGELSLYRQLRAAIEMAIIDGALPDGTALPSVRRLAASLNIAPITVVQAYRALQAEHLIRSVPKRGYFVSVGPVAEMPTADLRRVQSLLDEALAAALAAGLDTTQFLRLAADRVKRNKAGGSVVAVVGERAAALSERVAVVQQHLSDLDITVVGLSFEELESADFQPESFGLGTIECFLVPVGEVQRAARALGSHAFRILPMHRVLRADVQEFIRRQPPETRFGIIAGSAEFIERILVVLRRLHPLRSPPVVAAVDDRDQVAHVISEADAIVIGSVAKPRLVLDREIRQPHVEFVSIPDERTLHQLRSRLTSAWAEHRPASGTVPVSAAELIGDA